MRGTKSEIGTETQTPTDGRMKQKGGRPHIMSLPAFYVDMKWSMRGKGEGER